MFVKYYNFLLSGLALLLLSMWFLSPPVIVIAGGLFDVETTTDIFGNMLLWLSLAFVAFSFWRKPKLQLRFLNLTLLFMFVASIRILDIFFFPQWRWGLGGIPPISYSISAYFWIASAIYISAFLITAAAEYLLEKDFDDIRGSI